MARRGQRRQPDLCEAAFQRSGAFLVPYPERGSGLEVADAGERAGRNRRWQRAGENKTGGMTPDKIDEHLGSRDISADEAKCFGQRPSHDRHAVRQALSPADPAARRAIEPTAWTSSR
jgi:hypothetical protein